MRTRLNVSDQVFNVMTVVALAFILAISILTVIIFQVPDHPINPFPPPTMPAALVLPSETAGPLSSTATQTPLAEEISIVDPTVTATENLQPTVTNTQAATATLTETPPLSGYRYRIQGSPVPLSASIFNSERENCSWMGVAGQVQDLQDRPITGILVLLGGRLEGENLDQIMMTGTALNYGPAGYEFELTDHLVETSDRIWIQLVDQSYIPLSAKIYFNTYADQSCERNLTIINFKQVR